MAVTLKRIYDKPSQEDGYRILVDRLWPRGVKKMDAKIDEWLKALAPSAELRKWYHAGDVVARAEEFKKRYETELQQQERQVELKRVKKLADTMQVTLLTATKDVESSYLNILSSAIEK